MIKMSTLKPHGFLPSVVLTIPTVLILVLSISCFSTVLAQTNAVRVNVQILPPFSNDIHSYIGGSQNLDLRLQEQLIVTLQNNSATETKEVKLIATISGDNGLFASVRPNYLPLRSIVLSPGELKIISGEELKEINRNLTESDINYGGFDRDQLIRTGTLPEGTYRICIQAFDYNNNQTLSLADPIGCSPPIPIAFPDPPVIMYPFNNSEILANVPQALNISWAPAPNLTSIVRYRLRIVELSDINANPYDVMERSTISFFEEDNIEFTNFFYDQTRPNFKGGQTYAIRVQAYDPFNQLQIKNNGFSEIHVFEYVEQLSSGGTLADIDYINIEPGFLKLVDLENLQIREENDVNIFNGLARLEIKTLNQAQPDIIEVQVNNLAVQKGNNTSPVISEGEITARMSKIPQALDPLDGLVTVKEIQWRAGQGMSISGDIEGPDGKGYLASGNLQIRPNGIYGEISAKTSGKDPLFTFGGGPVQFGMNSFGITFPDACKSFDGYVRLFGEEKGEQLIPVGTLSCGEALRFDLALNLDQQLAIDAGNGKLHLEAKSLFGSVIPNWKDQSLFYDLELISTLGFDNIQETTCGLDLMIKLNSSTGMSVQEAGSSCTSGLSNIPLGPAYFSYSDFSLDRLDFNPSSLEWDFSLSFDGRFSFPVFGDFTTIAFNDVVIDKNGIGIPAMDFKKEDIYLTTKANWGDYLITLEEFKQLPVTLPIFKADKIGPADWDFNIKARVEFAEDDNLPTCLQGAAVNISALNFNGDLMNAIIEPQGIGDCSWNFGAGYVLNFNSLEGDIGIQFKNEGFQPVRGELTLDFDMLMGEPFQCDNQKPLPLLNSQLQIKNGLNGEIDKVVPSCKLAIGPLSAQITKSTIRFESSLALGQNIFLDGLAQINYKDLETEGSFTLDLKTGEFTKLSFDINEPFVLDLPSEQKALSFQINRAQISENGLLIDGRNELLVSDQSIGTTFNQTLFDLNTGRVKSGSIIVDSEFAFEASIDTNNQLQYRAVPFDHQLNSSPALLMQLAGNITIDSSGIAANGSAAASLQFEEYVYDSLEAVYDKKFKVGINPVQIKEGQVSFYYKEERIAYADVSGFHPDWTAFGKAFIPEKIPLPTEEIAYVKIKENDQLLVDISQDSKGNTIVSTKVGKPVTLYLPALISNTSQVPTIDIDFKDLVLDAGNGSVIGGALQVSVPEGDPLFDLTQKDIPLKLKEIAFGANGQGNDNVLSLFMRGNLHLFDNDLGDAASVEVNIQSDGQLRGVFDLTNLSIDAPMDGFNGLAKLKFSAINGSFNIPLLPNGNQPYLNLDFDAFFELYNPSADLIAQADFSAHYRPNDLSITNFNAVVDDQHASLDFDLFSFNISSLHQLDLTYTKSEGFSFDVNLDCSFGFALSEGDPFEFELKNVSLSSENGLSIPDQDIHDGTLPGFNPPAVDFGVFHLQPIAFRLPSININWFDLSQHQLVDFLPKIDLELSFPQLINEAPEFAQATLSFNDVGFDNGKLLGNMLPYTFPGDGVPLPIGGDLGINVKEIGGMLSASADSLQNFLIDLKGKLMYPDFLKKNPICTEADVSIKMDRLGYFSGQVEGFTPCGQLEQGPLTLKFNNTQLDFAVGLGKQKAKLSGSATALISRSNNTPVNATGNVSLDLVKGELLNGKILITGPFDWQYTEKDSLFNLTVQTAELDTTGIKFTGNGALKMGNGSSNLTYNDLTFSLTTGKLIGGDVVIKNSIALDLELQTAYWSVQDPAVPTENDPGIRLTMPKDLVLNKDGLLVNDSSVASLNYNGTNYDLLKVHYDNFNLNVNPIEVKSGTAHFFLDSINGSDPVRIAYYDKTGFHLDDGTSLIKAVLPDTLFLPAKEVAYIVLRDQNRNLLVDIESVPQGKKLSTVTPLPMVINSLNPNDSLTVAIRMYDFILDDGFQVVSGYLEADLNNDPIDLLPLEQMPLKLKKIAYLKFENEPYKLYADATLSLPESLNEVDVEFQKMEFGPDGFVAGRITAGTITQTYDANIPAVVEKSFNNDDFKFVVTGAEINIDPVSTTYFVSGHMGSSLFRDVNNNPMLIHYNGIYSTEFSWDFTANGHHLPEFELPVDQAKIILDSLDIYIDDHTFELVIDGRLTMDELMGEDFKIAIDDLKVGTEGISVSSVNSNVLQYLSLLNQVDNMKIQNLGLSFANSAIFLELDGSLNFVERELAFEELKIGTDGSFSIGGLNANLIDTDLEILGEYLILQEVNLTTVNNRIALSASGEVSLPEPFIQSDKDLSIAIDYLGNVELEMPSFTINEIPPVDLDGFATLTVTEVGVEFNPLKVSETVFFASANLDIPDKKNGGVNTIEFGTPNGDSQSAGLAYHYDDNRFLWQITNSPDFTFDQTFFKLTISNVAVSGGDGFRVSMDAEAQLQFDEVSGSGRIDDIIISQSGVEWGTFAGASFSFVDFVDIEVGQFEYFNTGGNITLRQGEQTAGGEISEQENKIYVDEYLRFFNPTGSALSISIGDPDGFSASGSIDEITYYRKGSELYFNIKDVDVRLHDYAKLYASIEYQKDDTGFLLRVAGSAFITPPAGDEIGVVAVGKLATINNKFSVGVFVATKGVPIPIIPAIVEINSFGGGFFYNAESEDINMVLSALNYDPYNAGGWETDNEDFDFAIIFYGGVGVIGTTGTYTFSGEMLMVITPDFLKMDAKFDMNTAPIRGGAYFTMEFEEGKFTLEAGGGVELKDLGVVKGGLGVNFTAVKADGQDLQWAFTGGTTVTGGTPITIVGILEANATVVVNNDGFLLDCNVDAGFDVWIISVKGGLDASVWYLKKQQQFGAYVTVSVEASVLGGLAKLGGEAKGVLILERNDFLIYASLKGYVEVAFVFEGDITVWLSIDKNGFDAGKGNSGYEHLIAAAEESATQMNEKAQALLTSIDNAKNVVVPLTSETLAQAGQALYMAPKSVRTQWGNQFIQNEGRIQSPISAAFNRLRDLVVEDRPSGGGRSNNLTYMKNAVQDLNAKIADVIPQMQQLKTSAINWEDQSYSQLAELKSPLRSAILNWQGDIAPSFDIDTIQSNSNSTSSTSLRQAMAAVSVKDFRSMIDTTLANIRRIERTVDGRPYTLVYTPNKSDDNVLALSTDFHKAVFRTRRYYSKEISYFWALNHWSKEKLRIINQGVNPLNGPIDQANKRLLKSWGITYDKGLFSDGKYHINSIIADANGVNIVATNGTDANGITQLTGSVLNSFASAINIDLNDFPYIGNRRSLINKMIPGTTAQQASNKGTQLSNSLYGLNNSRDYYDMIEAIELSTQEMVLMHTKGLEAIRDMSGTKADSMVTAAGGVLRDLKSEHVSFTGLLNDIYNIKHNMLINLHGMYETYLAWASISESSRYYLNDQKREIEDILSPPKLNSIGFSSHPGDTGYDREMLITWNHTHDYNWNQGVVESSYDIKYNSSNNIYGTRFVTSGTTDGIYHHIYANDLQDLSKPLSIKVRLRGPGGNTVTRAMSRTLDLGPNTIGDLPILERDVLDDDSTPPSTPIVNFNYRKASSSQLLGQRYWSNTPGEIALSIVAIDNESDIAKLEFALGKVVGGTDVVSWRTVYGKNAISGNNSLGNLIKKVVVNNLDLQTNQDYFVSVRVKNGEGLMSEEKNVAIPIRLDLTAPQKPADETLLSGGFTGGFTFWGPIFYQPNVVTEAPDFVIPPSDIVPASKSAYATWSIAQDDLSGVYEYHYVLSENPNAAMAYEVEEVEQIRKNYPREITIDGDPLSFTDTTYIHVWAVDHAKNKSEPLTYIRMPQDPSAPSTPSATIMMRPDQLRLYLKKPSFDAESSIKGFQYAIGSTPYGTDIKDWPLDNQLDDLHMGYFAKFVLGLWRLDAQENLNRINQTSVAPYYEIEANTLPEGVPLYVTYRTLNGQNMKSGVSPTGPVTLDSSAPFKPNVTLTDQGGKIKIAVSNIRDNESDISQVEYKVVDNKYRTVSPTVPWKTLVNVSGTTKTPISGTKIENYSNGYDKVRIAIRLTNGNGMQSTYWFDADQYMQVIVNQGNKTSSRYNFNWSGK